ncbi:hypothetical protein ACLOJK_027693 [Asimina triloba]
MGNLDLITGLHFDDEFIWNCRALCTSFKESPLTSAILSGICFCSSCVFFLQYSEIKRTNNNLVVIGKMTVDNDKEDFDADADDDDGDNVEESDGEEFEQEAG